MRKLLLALMLLLTTTFVYSKERDKPIKYGATLYSNTIFRGMEQTDKVTIYPWITGTYKGFTLKTAMLMNYDATYKVIEFDLSTRICKDIINISLNECYEPLNKDYRINDSENHTVFFNFNLDWNGDKPFEVEWSKLIYSTKDYDSSHDKYYSDYFSFKYKFLDHFNVYVSLVANASEYYSGDTDFITPDNYEPKIYNLGMKYYAKVKETDIAIDLVHNLAYEKTYITFSIGI